MSIKNITTDDLEKVTGGTEASSYECPFCEECFDTVREYALHIRDNHRDLPRAGGSKL